MRSFVVVYEAPADFTIATVVADRVLLAEVDWLEEELLGYQRQWIGEEPPGHRLTWTAIAKRARVLGINVRGHFKGEPMLPDAKAARRAIEYARHQLANVDAILLIRDVDDQAERLGGLEQARAANSSAIKIIIGAAIRERECWVISGFRPANKEESERLALEKQKLGWDPCFRSHELTAGKDDQAVKSPKRVLQHLTAGDLNRERECWEATPLNHLEERGKKNGMANYIAEIRLRLVPLITA